MELKRKPRTRLADLGTGRCNRITFVRLLQPYYANAVQCEVNVFFYDEGDLSRRPDEVPDVPKRVPGNRTDLLDVCCVFLELLF